LREPKSARDARTIAAEAQVCRSGPINSNSVSIDTGLGLDRLFAPV
jgi:hypothetical protein